AIGYGIGRFWVEGLRIDPATDVAGLRWNQWMALIAVAVGVTALVVTRGRTWDAAAVRTGGTRQPGGTSGDAGDPVPVGAVAIGDDTDRHADDATDTSDSDPSDGFDSGSF